VNTLIYVVFLLFFLTHTASADERVDRLPEIHKSWIERDVVYIITDREREVFLTLESVDERDRFIEAFWRRRDPNAVTPVNEFREEHYRRIEYANTQLGRDTFREGWQSDRGRFYIILGEPREIQRFDGYNELVSSHLWFYQAERNLGIPSFFYLLFYRRGDIGEYELYNPMIDGPQALLRSAGFAPGTNNAGVIDTLRQISPELAAASLSFDPSEPPDFASGRANIGTDMMIARIVEAPKRAVRTEYADAGLRYGDRVSSDYTFNFVPSRSVFSVLFEPVTEAPLVHFSVELDPQNLSLETDEDKSKFYTTLDITIEARNAEGTLVVATDKQAYVELSPSEMQAIQAQPFAYQDDFLLVPGDYAVSVIVRNRVLSQYTVAEAELRVPRVDPSQPMLSDVILAYETRPSSGESDPQRFYTYEIGDVRIYPAAEGLFVIGDTVHLFVEVVGDLQNASAYRVIFELRRDGETLKTLEHDVEGKRFIVEHLRLDDLVGGDYEVLTRLIALTSEPGDVVSTRTSPLTLSPRSFAARPGFVYRRGLDTSIDGLLHFLRGEQLWNLGRFEDSTAALERAVASGNEQLAPATWKLANAYLREQRFDDALALLEPLEFTFSDRYEVIAGLGFAFYFKGEHESAIGYFLRARQLASPDTMLLNALGDSYQELGQLDEAREALERSLALDDAQPAVKKRLASF
jgi:GWxTD domain-containing protein